MNKKTIQFIDSLIGVSENIKHNAKLLAQNNYSEPRSVCQSPSNTISFEWRTPSGVETLEVLENEEVEIVKFDRNNKVWFAQIYSIKNILL